MIMDTTHAINYAMMEELAPISISQSWGYGDHPLSSSPPSSPPLPFADFSRGERGGEGGGAQQFRGTKMVKSRSKSDEMRTQ